MSFTLAGLMLDLVAAVVLLALTLRLKRRPG
jgi:hypothetical protein